MEPEKTDHDLLVETANDVRWLRDVFDKHLSHHKQLTYVGIGGVITVLIGLLFIIL